MEFIGTIFHELFYRPILNFLIFLYNTLPGGDFGAAIIALTLFFRAVFYPLNTKAIKAQKDLQELQPRLKEVQEKYKKDRQKQAEELMKFYKENKVSPFSSITPVLIQFPILIALFQVLTRAFDGNTMEELYSFISIAGEINPIAFGALNLTEPSIILGALAAALTFWQLKMLAPPASQKEPKEKQGPDFKTTLQKQTLFLMPLFTLFIASKFAAGLALYWVFTTAGAIVQQYLVQKNNKTIKQ